MRLVGGVVTVGIVVAGFFGNANGGIFDLLSLDSKYVPNFYVVRSSPRNPGPPQLFRHAPPSYYKYKYASKPSYSSSPFASFPKPSYYSSGEGWDGWGPSISTQVIKKGRKPHKSQGKVVDEQTFKKLLKQKEAGWSSSEAEEGSPQTSSKPGLILGMRPPKITMTRTRTSPSPNPTSLMTKSKSNSTPAVMITEDDEDNGGWSSSGPFSNFGDEGWADGGWSQVSQNDGWGEPQQSDGWGPSYDVGNDEWPSFGGGSSGWSSSGWKPGAPGAETPVNSTEEGPETGTTASPEIPDGPVAPEESPAPGVVVDEEVGPTEEGENLRGPSSMTRRPMISVAQFARTATAASRAPQLPKVGLSAMSRLNPPSPFGDAEVVGIRDSSGSSVAVPEGLGGYGEFDRPQLVSGVPVASSIVQSGDGREGSRDVRFGDQIVPNSDGLLDDELIRMVQEIIGKYDKH